MSFKKIFLCSVLSFQAMAQLPSSGYYMGLNQGYSCMEGSFKGEYRDKNRNNFNSSRIDSFKNSSYIFEFLGGYRHVFKNKLTLGGDISFSRDGHEEKKDYIDNNVFTGDDRVLMKLKSDYMIIPSVTMGYFVTPTCHLFGKVGLAMSHVTGTVQNVRRMAPKTKKEMQYGTALSLGLDYALNNHWSAVVTTSYVQGQKLSFHQDPVLDGINSSFHMKTTPRYFSQKIGFIYRF